MIGPRPAQERGTRMSKRERRPSHQRPVQPLTSPEEARARVESLIASGKTREALDLAKQWSKEARSAEAEALVIAAYEARIAAMLAQGLHDEATALAALVGERFPAHRQRIAPLVSQSKAIAAGDLGALLAELAAAAPPRRREIEAILTRELRDPRLLADADALAADDPLRRAAGAVSELFAAATSGPLAAGALAALDQIPRHSPLAPWKLLIRAIDAYYRRADGAALANLDAIPPHAAPARLVPVLRHLIGEPGAPDQRSPAASALIQAVSGGRMVLRHHLVRLVRALDAKDPRAAVAAVERIMPSFELDPPALKRLFTATVLQHWDRLNLNPKPLIETLRADRRDLDWQRETERLIALTLERAGAWAEALIFWDRYLTAAIRAGTLPATGRAPARVLLHMADLFPADRDEMLDALDIASEEEIEVLIRSGELAECATAAVSWIARGRPIPIPACFAHSSPTGRRATLGRPRPTRKRGGRRTRGISIHCCTWRARPRGATPTAGRSTCSSRPRRSTGSTRGAAEPLPVAPRQRGAADPGRPVRARPGRISTASRRNRSRRAVTPGPISARSGRSRHAGAATVPAPSGCTRSWRHGSATPRRLP